jgi:hypothetical protein
MLDTTSLQIMPRRRLDLGGLAMKAMGCFAAGLTPIPALAASAVAVTAISGLLGLSDLACGLLAAYAACLMCLGLGMFLGRGR